MTRKTGSRAEQAQRAIASGDKAALRALVEQEMPARPATKRRDSKTAGKGSAKRDLARRGDAPGSEKTPDETAAAKMARNFGVPYHPSLFAVATINGKTTPLYRNTRTTRGEFGSTSKEFEAALPAMLGGTLRFHQGTSDEIAGTHLSAAWAAVAGIGPKSELEGMLAAQMVATYEAAMSCFQRAAWNGQSNDVRDRELSQANRLVRSYAALVAALDKHRGKGQQTVRVEHVHVHEGGQAIVGHISHDGRRREEEVAAEAVVTGGGARKMTIDHMRLAPRCGARAKRTGRPCMGPAMRNGRCRLHGGKSTGPAEGSQNALKHGLRTAEAVERRKAVNVLLRASREILQQLDGEGRSS